MDIPQNKNHTKNPLRSLRILCVLFGRKRFNRKERKGLQTEE